MTQGDDVHARRRWRGGIAAAVVLVAAGCSSGGDAVEIDDATGATGTASPESPEATDAAGFTPEERRAVDAVERYLAALAAYQRGEADDLAGTATAAWEDTITGEVDAQLRDEGLTVLGDVELEPLEAEVDADGAQVLACVDATNVFVVEQGSTEVSAGATSGARSRTRYGLVADGDDWIVDDPRSEGGAAC